MSTLRRSMGLAVAYDAFANYLTVGNSYADVPNGVLGCGLFRTKKFAFTATTNDLEVQILGSIDGGVTYPFTAVATFDIAAAATVTQEITSAFTHLKVQVRPNVGGAHGTLATKWLMASF